MAVVHNDRAVFLGGYGTRRLGSGLAVTPDTVFQLASLSKPIGATVVAAAVGAGQLDWDSPVQRWLPDTTIGGPLLGPRVSVRDLLSHRSGLPDHAGDDLEDIGFDRATILRRLSLLDTANRFRAAYAYTNFGFTAGAEAAAIASSSSWEELSQQRLYGPLGMASTSSRHSDYLGRANRADLHQRVAGVWRLSPGRQPDAQSPAGGVSSSVRDLSQWLRLLLNRGSLEGTPLLAASALDETHRPQVISGPPADPAREQAQLYGLGWIVGAEGPSSVRLSHSGAFAMGAATTVALLPARDLGIVVLTNGSPIGVPETIAASFLDLVEVGAVQRDYPALLAPVFAALIQPDYPVVTAESAPALLPLQRYSGSYRNAYVGAAEVVEQAGGLVLLLGPQRRPFPLTSLGGHRFSFQPSGENAAGPAALQFRAGADGHISEVVIDTLNGAGMGTLQRRP